MKKNIRVVQINGFRGLFLAIFIVSCLFAGFIAFPAFLSMHLWNFLAVKTGSMPNINLIEGILLWGIIALTFIIINKRKFIVSFNSQQELTEDELKTVMNKIKDKGIDTGIIVPKDNNFPKEISQEPTEVNSEQNK